MATVKRKDAGKSMFLKEYLVDHPEAGTEAIAGAWREAGHAGTISARLASKVRRDLGLTGRGTAAGKSRTRGGTSKRSSAGSESDSRRAGRAVGGRTPAVEDGGPVAQDSERSAAPRAGRSGQTGC